MKNILANIIILLVTVTGFAEAQNLQFNSISGGGGTGAEKIKAACQLSNSEVVLAGTFQGEYNIADTMITSHMGSTDIFIECRNESGLSWYFTFGGSCQENISSVASTPNNEILVTGTFVNYTIINGITLFSNGGTDFFIACFDSTGSLLWVNSFGGPGNDISYKLYCNSPSSFFIATTGNNWNFPGSDQPADYNTLSVSKFDLTCNLIWTRSETTDSLGYMEAGALNSDSAGNLYMSVNYFGNIAAGDNGTSLLSSNLLNTALFKYDDFGKSGGIFNSGILSGSIKSSALTVSADGSLLMTGTMNGSILFANTIYYSGDDDTFLAKIDKNLQPESIHLFNVPGSQITGDMIELNDQEIILTGYYLGDFYSGWNNLTNTGGTDIFITRYNLVTDHTLSVTMGGPYNDFSTNLLIQGSKILCFGYYSEGGTSYISTGNSQIYSAGDADYFICKLTSEQNYSTSIGELQDVNSIEIFPNPATEYINIKNNTDAVSDIQIFDSLGKLVRKTNTNSEPIDVSDLDPGNYVIQINQGIKTVKRKFIIKR